MNQGSVSARRGLGHGSAQAQGGFTLLEVLVVVGIISILLMVGTPIFQSYSIRAKMGAELAQMADLKQRVTENYMIDDRWVINNEEAGGKDPQDYGGQYVESVEITDTPVPGSILITYDSVAIPVLGASNTLIFKPVTTVTDGLQWVCEGGSVVNKYRPKPCQ